MPRLDSSPTPDYYFRLFAVEHDGTVREMRASHSLSAAYDMLTDAGFDLSDPEGPARLLVAADQPGAPMTPEHLARKLISFRKITRQGQSSPPSSDADGL